MVERTVKSVDYEYRSGKYDGVDIVLILDNGDKVRISDTEFKKIDDEAP